MNKRNKLIIASTLLIGTITATSFALAHGRHHDGGFGAAPERIERMVERFDLSDAQRDSIRAIVDQARPVFREYGDKLQNGHRQLHELAQADNMDQSALRSLADAQGDAMADMIVLRTQVMHDMRAVLTPEQRAELDDRKERHGRRHGGWRD